MSARIRVAIHGGCGNITRDGLGAARERAVREALREITAAALVRLREGACAMDVVEYAVVLLEDSEHFNAGYGSVLNADGHVEMDAAVMDGSTGSAGAVGAVRSVKNPVRVARAVMEHPEFAFLAGDGARRFAAARGFELVDDDALVTAHRRRQLERARSGGRVSLDHDEYYGTVGAVARDADGRLAAATSTGGMTNKHPGRIGDTPVIGAGTWADDATCAVSGTGHGEYFLRTAFAHDVHARMRHGGASLEAACGAALDAVASLGGSGGAIAVDRDGNLALRFNTAGMYRGWAGADGEPGAGIWGEES